MRDLIQKLKVIAIRVNVSDTPIIEAAIDRIKELEEKLSLYEDDVTDWQFSVEAQMKRKEEEK